MRIIAPSKKRGFTLIELLVVIAIIAILAAILFPVFARARENARRASCQSNLKQIGLGVMQYSQDYDEQMPRAWTTGLWNTDTPAGTYYKWMDAIQPYVKSAQLFNCPSDSSGYPYKTRDQLSGNTENNWGSYAMNSTYWNTGNVNLKGPGNDSMNQAAFGSISTTVWCTDGNGAFQFAWADKAAGQQAVNNIQKIGSSRQMGIGTPAANDHREGAIVERHLETVNVLFCDGHVKAMKLDALVATGTTTDANTTGYLKYFTPQDD